MSDTAILNDVSDTALWVAVYRARESERSDALFHDPHAAKLAGERGSFIDKKMSDSPYVEWLVVVRTHMIDGFLHALLAEGLDTVVNIGAGLDTRPYRMNLPANLRWIEVDFPRIINLKNERLSGEKPRCRLERISLDLSKERERHELFSRINAESKNVLVITEGVTPYLTNDAVASLAKTLYAQSHFNYFVTDYVSAELMKLLKRSKKQREMKNAPFVFDPGEWTKFFADLGWKVRDLQYIGVEGDKLNRPPPHPWWFKLMLATVVPKAKVEESRRVYGYALLERQR